MRIKRQSGSSLVEVMVALFVLAIGLLGVLAMQSKSMQYNQSAHTYSRAVYLANDLAERIRTNAGAAAAYTGMYEGEVVPTLSKDCESGSCDAGELAVWDRETWDDTLAKALPLGEATVTEVNAAGTIPKHLKIEVSFDDSRVEGANESMRQKYSLLVGL